VTELGAHLLAEWEGKPAVGTWEYEADAVLACGRVVVR
jgi:hypothetical protein